VPKWKSSAILPLASSHARKAPAKCLGLHFALVSHPRVPLSPATASAATISRFMASAGHIFDYVCWSPGRAAWRRLLGGGDGWPAVGRQAGEGAARIPESVRCDLSPFIPRRIMLSFFSLSLSLSQSRTVLPSPGRCVSAPAPLATLGSPHHSLRALQIAADTLLKCVMYEA
jgi:hypothetical protein